MQEPDEHPRERIPYSASELQLQAAATVCHEDCRDMLNAIRERVSGLVAPVANGHSPAGLAALRHAGLVDCNHALDQLWAMLGPHVGGTAQLAHDLSELRIDVATRLQHKR